MTSDTNGRNTTSRKTTGIRKAQDGITHGASARATQTLTLVPQVPVAVSHLSLADLRQIKDAYAQTDVVQDAVRVLFVELGDERLLWRYPEIGRVNSDRFLCC
jgi:hypothetical protein